jgi:hypothetical protein
LGKIARLLEADGIPYAIIGAMALNAYPGDGLPKSVAFLDPATTAVRGERADPLSREAGEGRGGGLCVYNG